MGSPKYGASLHLRTFCAMLRMLYEGGYTKDDMADKLGLERTTVIRWMRLMGSQDPEMRGRLVYIVSWRSSARGNPAAEWAFGFEMPDAPKPPPMTSAQYTERYRAKKRRVFGLTGVQR